MSEFRKGQYTEEDLERIDFEAQSFESNETKIPDEDPDNKVEAPEPEATVEVLANEPEPDVESGQEIVSLSEAAALEKIISKYGDGDWQKNYDTSGEYKFNKVARVMEQETETGEVKNITQTIQGEKYISLHQESLQAWNDGEIHLMESEKITDNGVVLEVLAQWVEDDGRIRSISWSREVVKSELPEVEDGSDDEGGDEDESVGSVDEVVPDNVVVAATENSTIKAEVVIEMGADWEDEADGGSDEEDNNVSSVQSFGFQTQSVKVVENPVAQVASLKSVDTLQARLVESANFHEVADVVGDAPRNEIVKDTEAIVLEKKDYTELAPGSNVDKANSFVESINIFGESVATVESVDVVVSAETTEFVVESESYAEDIATEQTVVKSASAETGDVVIDMDAIWGEVEVDSESYETDRELNIAEQPNNVVSNQEVVSHEYVVANESKEESVKKVGFAREETNLAIEQSDANFASEQITNAASTEVFGRSVEISTQSTEDTPAFETVQEAGSIIQMFEQQKENSFELNQDKVELGSIEQSGDVIPKEIINSTEEVLAVESFEYDGVQKVVAEASTTETATVINLADYWEKDADVKNDNKLNSTEQPAAVSFEQKIITSEPSVAVEQVQSVADSKPAKVSVEQNGSEPDVVEAANIINMAAYWRGKNQKEEDFSVPNFEAQPPVLNTQEEQLNTFSNSYVPVADEVLVQDGAREIELIQQAA